MKKKPLIILLIVIAILVLLFFYVRNVFIANLTQRASSVAVQQAVEQARNTDYTNSKLLKINETIPKIEVFRFATGVNKGNINVSEGKLGLLTGEIKYLGLEPKPTIATEGNVFAYVINSLDESGEQRAWYLPTNQLIRLEAAAGIGFLKLDLRKLMIETLNVGVGAGKTTILLSEKYDTTGNIGAGSGSLQIGVPANVGFKLTLAEGMTLDLAETSDLIKKDDGYETANFSTASVKSSLHLANASGTVEIISIPDDFKY